MNGTTDIFGGFQNMPPESLRRILIVLGVVFILLLAVGALTIEQLIGRGIGLIIGFTVHEYAHAWMAYKLGDNTARSQGRLTLDPRSHLDPFGTFLALLIGFGWAKPVPYNPWAVRPNPQRGGMYVAVAGPISNLIVAIIFGILLSVMVNVGFSLFFTRIVLAIVLLNMVLFLFNLIPLPPLDGWKILHGVVDNEQSMKLRQYERQAFFLLIVLLMLRVPFIFLGPLIDGFLNIFV